VNEAQAPPRPAQRCAPPLSSNKVLPSDPGDPTQWSSLPKWPLPIPTYSPSFWPGKPFLYPEITPLASWSRLFKVLSSSPRRRPYHRRVSYFAWCHLWHEWWKSYQLERS